MNVRLEAVSIAVLLGPLAAPASAQVPPAANAPPPPAESPAPTATTGAPSEGSTQPFEEEVVVTGTRVRRKDLATPAPVAIIAKDQIQQSGKATIGEFLQLLPEQGNAPNFQLNNGGSTYSADGATRVNLRSLGVNRTLVLVNGRRFVASGVGASPTVDLNTIPIAAVERIEILKDGASAIYGSDAIAGVVNVITRSGFDGTEAAAFYGISGQSDAQTFDGQLTLGRTGNTGEFLFSVGYTNQGSSWLHDRTWSKEALTYDYRTRTAIPGGSFRTPEGTIGLPANADGTPLAACLANPLCNDLVQNNPNWASDSFIRDLANPVNAPQGWRAMSDADRYNFASENYLTIPSTRAQVWSAGNARFDQVRVFYEASYVQNTTQQNAAPFPLNPSDYTLPDGTLIQVSANSMYNPFGVDLPFAGRRLVEFGDRLYKQDLATFRVVTGLDGGLPGSSGPLSGWGWDVAINYGCTTGTFTTEGAIRNSKIADAVGPSMTDASGTPRCVRVAGDINTVIPGCVPLNLFGGPGTIDPSQQANLGFTGTSRAFDDLLAVTANAAGDLGTLWGDRPLSLAVGYEYRRQAGAQIADPIAASGDSADFNFTTTEGSFYANEVYGELSIPILVHRPAVQNLEASLAGRYVNYDTFGGNFTYKTGARYTPIPDVTLRGTYSTAFRAPTVNELFLGQQETAPTAGDLCASLAGASPALVAQCTATGVGAAGSGDNSNQVLTRTGGNKGLQPETARTITAGLVLEPRVVKSLTVTVDFYDITVDDIIGTLGTPTILAACYPAAFNSAAAPQFCNLVSRASTGRILFVSDQKVNSGQLHTSGIDLAARYRLPTPVGHFGFSFDGTWLSVFDIENLGQTIHGKGNFDLAGRGYGGALPEWKFNLGAQWANAGWSAGALARYVGSFKECAASDGTSVGGLCYVDSSLSRQVGSNVVVDLNAGYQIKSRLGKTSLLVGVNNVLDKAPQYVYSAPLANSDPATYDFVGRFFYTRLAQAF